MAQFGLILMVASVSLVLSMAGAAIGIRNSKAKKRVTRRIMMEESERRLVRFQPSAQG
jgi:hypothetical protein